MSNLVFGFVPEKGILYLSRYSDFVSEIISDTGTWPDRSVLEFRFLPANSATWTSWPATIVDAIASWTVDKADVATLLDAGITQYRLFYTQDDYDLEWSQGPVRNVS